MANESNRRYERIPTELSCRLFIPGEGERDPIFEAYSITGNLCLGGVFLTSEFLMKNGVELMIELSLPDGPLALEGCVVHVVGHDDPREQTGMGIEFLNVSPHARETLLRYFTPERYHNFFGHVLGELPHLEQEFQLQQISLVLNLWEEWKITREGGPKATEAGAPEPVLRSRFKKQ